MQEEAKCRTKREGFSDVHDIVIAKTQKGCTKVV